MGTSSTWWLGPYVLVTRVEMAGRPARTTVTWLSADGNVLKEISSSRIESSGIYILEYRDSTYFVHTIYDTSVIIVRQTRYLPGESGAIDGQDYGKFFSQQYINEKGHFIDYYARGQFVGTFGPLYWKTGSVFGISSSGSFAYTMQDSAAGGPFRIVSADSLGRTVFSFRPDGAIRDIVPAPSGNLVIINYNGDEKNHIGINDFACFSSSGRTVRANLYPNGALAGWVPNTEEMIVTTALGNKYTYNLLDWRTGKLLWSVSNPLEYMGGGLAISEKYLLLSGMAIRQSIPHGPVIPNDLRGTIRMLAAIDIQKGKLVAKWYEPTFSGRWQIGQDFPPMPDRGGRLIWYHGDLYHVTEVNFSKIDFGDIDSLRNGWVGPSDSGAVCSDVGL